MKRVYAWTLQSGLSQTGSYVLMLLEPESQRRVPVIIGAAEAQAILLAKKQVTTRRPMTHEMITRIMDAFGLSLKEVVIDHVYEGVFYATLHLTDGFNEKQIDSRSTDAIALALHCDAPIMMADAVIEETAVAADPDQQNTPKPTLQQLEEELERCEQQEDYERAAELQRKIDELKQQS